MNEEKNEAGQSASQNTAKDAAISTSEKACIYLFTVTTILEECPPMDRRYSDRTPVICTSLERAERIVEQNVGDLHEQGYYRLAVIERKVSDVMYGFAVPDLDEQNQWWYRYSEEHNGYVKCDRPTCFAHIVGFGVG